MTEVFRYLLDTLHPKKRRTSNPATVWDIESEQEEHSLSLSQHSSPSQSDQEQTPESITGSKGFNLFKCLNQVPNNSQLNSIPSNHHVSRNMIPRTPQDHLFPSKHQDNEKSEQLVNVVHAGQQGTQYPTMELKPGEAESSIHNLVKYINVFKIS